MPLIVEDGSKPQNANSYCSIEFADNYHELMGDADWAGFDTATKTSALIKATESLDLLYGQRYLSMRWPGVQSLLWPRYVFVDRNNYIRQQNEIPVELQKAVAIHAMNIANGLEAYPQPNQASKVKKEKYKSEGSEVDIEYRSPVDVETFAGLNRVELLLGPILKSKLSNNIVMAR